MISEGFILVSLLIVLIGSALKDYFSSLTYLESILIGSICASSFVIILGLLWEFKSKSAKEWQKRRKLWAEIPKILTIASDQSVFLGQDDYLKSKLYLPDSIRRRHVHVLGATGSGKTESVILNFLKQDVRRGFGGIILDAKGDHSFVEALQSFVPKERLKIFDLGSELSATYDPLAAGTGLESAQRLFSSLTWSEEYYKSKALSTIQRLFQSHIQKAKRNPTLKNLSFYLDDPNLFSDMVKSEVYPSKMALQDFKELSGLRDQIRTLCTGHLENTLSPTDTGDLDLSAAKDGAVIYFRLQSLMSPQLVGIVGKLVINHLSYLAGVSHRDGTTENRTSPFIPTYLDEFASFACPEFADLISKARSAGLALHFSHQSVGDVAEVSEGFLSRITDNAGTKIVLRISDPDSAEFFARSFGTRLYQKVTQKLTRAEDLDDLELAGEGSLREAHQFRASPDMLKTLPTG
ncbi:MAG: type IV secretion system DNA-binding domain-containing protein, partial [Bdellovibrionales bacterium]|nr:type IV secretion system DNA-binding domain-containing protein [Bdellovibrionales bacterium]